MKAEEDQARRKHSRQKACKNKARQLKEVGMLLHSSLWDTRLTKLQARVQPNLCCLCACWRKNKYLSGQRETTLHLRAPSQLGSHCSSRFALLLSWNIYFKISLSLKLLTCQLSHSQQRDSTLQTEKLKPSERGPQLSNSQAKPTTIRCRNIPVETEGGFSS